MGRTQVQRRILLSNAWCRCCASHRPPYACRSPKWIDNFTGKSLRVITFQNIESKHELDLVKWIIRSKNKSNESRNGKCGCRFSRNAWSSEKYTERTPSVENAKKLEAQSVGGCEGPESV